MSDEQIKDQIRRQFDLNLLNIVKSGVEAHIYPFDPGLISMQLFEELGGPGWIKVASSTFVDDIFHMSRMDIFGISDEVSMAYYIGDKAGAFFLSLMTIKPEPNIILGED